MTLGFFLFAGTIAALTVPVATGSREWGDLESTAVSVLPIVGGVAATVLAFYFAEGGRR